MKTSTNTTDANRVGSTDGSAIARKETWRAFNSDWCPLCGRVTKMERIRTGMPGIQAAKCPDCGTHYQANFLEDGEDMLDVPTNFTWPNIPVSRADANTKKLSDHE